MLPSLFKEEGLFPMIRLRSGIDRLFEDFFTDEKALAPFQAGKLPALDVKAERSIRWTEELRRRSINRLVRLPRFSDGTKRRIAT